jgi:ankyrin repeat protein
MCLAYESGMRIINQNRQSDGRKVKEIDPVEEKTVGQPNAEINAWIESFGTGIDVNDEKSFAFAIEEVWALEMVEFTDWYRCTLPLAVYDARRQLARLGHRDEWVQTVISRLDKEHASKTVNYAKAQFLALLYHDGCIEGFAEAFDRYGITLEEASRAELLLFAILHADEKVVKYLLDRGVKSDLPSYSNSEDTYHVTPLRLALDVGDMQVVRTLLDRGHELPTVLQRDGMDDFFEREGAIGGETGGAELGDTALITAYLFLTDRMDCLALYAPYDQKDDFGNNILHYLASDDVDEVPEVLTAPQGRKGITPEALNEANKHGQTPLHVAIAVENWPILSAFIDFGPDLARPEFDDLAQIVEEADTPPDNIIEAFDAIGFRF